MGMPGYCVLFLCMLVPLRSDAGGYHAPNLFICYLLSFASLILTMFWAKETSVFQLAIVSALALGSLLLIFLFAPLDSKNRPLEGQERKCIRKRARIVVCLEWITGGLLLLVSPPAAYTVWSAIVWSGVGYIAWYLERKIEARPDRNIVWNFSGQSYIPNTKIFQWNLCGRKSGNQVCAGCTLSG